MKVLISPSEAIREAKTEKSIGKSIGILAIAGILFGVAFAIGLIAFIGFLPFRQLATVGMAGTVITIFIGVLIAGLFYGFVTKTIMNILGGKGGYFEGLTAISYTIFPISIGAFITAILSYIPIVGIIISFFVLVLFLALGMAIAYRALKELFGVDMIVAFIGVTVISSTVIFAAYISMISGLILGLRPLPSLTGFP